jgi:RimJ/RimL family protein N-acetyltransferase
MPLVVPDLADGELRLRPPERGDVDAVTVACQDPEIARFTRVPSPYERAHAEGWIAHAADAWRAGTEAVFVVVDTQGGELLGSVGLMRLDDDRAVAEIGYWVAAGARQRGVATRSVRLVSRWAVRDLGVRRLELMTHVENVASQRVAASTGFVREGVLRSYVTLECGVSDVVMFSLLPRDLDAPPRD